MVINFCDSSSVDFPIRATNKTEVRLENRGLELLSRRIFLCAGFLVDLGVVLQLENRTKLRSAHGLEESSVGFGAFGVLSRMAPKQDSVEGIVLQYVNEQNRPLNAQNVSDSLQKHGIKKALVQKVLDTLAADAKISFKEYGKQKVYLANQAQFEIPNLDELDEMKKQNDGLQAHVSALRACVTTLEAEVRSTETSLTLDQIREKAKKLNVEISEMETKLSVLCQGTVLVAPEERKQVEESYNLKLGMWRKRKNMFRDLWATITEAMTEDSKQLKTCSINPKEEVMQEELSIEFDEDLGINIADYSNLGIKKLKKGYPTSK